MHDANLPPGAAQAMPHADRRLSSRDWFDQDGHHEASQLLPFVKLRREPHSDSAAAPWRGCHAHGRAMADTHVVPPQAIMEGDILELWRGRQTADSTVGPGRHRKAGPKMLVVTGPGIRRIGIEQALQLGDQVVIGDIAQVVPAQRGTERIRFGLGHDDAASDGIDARFELPQVRGDPGGRHLGITVC